MWKKIKRTIQTYTVGGARCCRGTVDGRPPDAADGSVAVPRLEKFLPEPE